MQTLGGVLLIWDKRVIVIVGQFSVSVLLRGVVDDFVWACTGVYGPNDNGQRSTLWEELSQVRVRWPMAWCLVGDFNIIKYPSEKLGYESFSPAMFAFSDFIENNSLVDLPLKGHFSLGLEILVFPLCQELTGPWFLLIGRSTLRMYPNM